MHVSLRLANCCAPRLPLCAAAFQGTFRVRAALGVTGGEWPGVAADSSYACSLWHSKADICTQMAPLLPIGHRGASYCCIHGAWQQLQRLVAVCHSQSLLCVHAAWRLAGWTGISVAVVWSLPLLFTVLVSYNGRWGRELGELEAMAHPFLLLPQLSLTTTSNVGQVLHAAAA
jgi:hypothetical protein